MPDSYNNLIERLSNGGTVVTATVHLKRELRRQFDRRQLALGKTAWESADILQWRDWLTRTWQNLSVHLDAYPTVLGELQVVAAWEDIIQRDIDARVRDDAPLWNIHAAAISAVGAWRILHAWNITLQQCAQSAHEDHQCMVRWAKRFEKLCAQHNWTDSYRLPDEIRIAAEQHGHLLTAVAPITLVGFEQLLPQQQTLITALQNVGVEINRDAITDTDMTIGATQSIECRRYSNDATQWLSAAHWARQKLADKPDARIAIIAPDLHKSGGAIEYALQQLVCPRHLAEPSVHSDLPYHLSTGKQLHQHPIAAAALIALAPMAGKPLSSDALSQLIRSPFLHAAEQEASARAQLEQWCRRRLPYQIHFRQLVTRQLTNGQVVKKSPDINPFANAVDTSDTPIVRHDCPNLMRAFHAALPLLDGIDNPQSAAHWADYFGTWLRKLGWPGERQLNSDEFQIVRAFREQLRNLALLDLTTKPMNAAAAYTWLQRRVAAQAFQVEAHDAPIHVLSVAEASGQKFDAIWFGGLIENDWPPVLRPNPFIAIAVQRAAGVTEASLECNHELATLQQQRLIASGAEIVFSLPATVEEVAVQPSALFAELNKLMEVATPDFNTPANIIHNDASNRCKLQSFTDTHGAPLAPHEKIHGGASLIQNQAQCPFRAFAIHRLGAREVDSNEQGLDAGERGSLIHHALQLVWAEIKNSQALHSLPDDEIKTIIRNAAEQAALRYQVSSGCGARFQQTQIRWVCDLLAEWLELEKQRADAFVINALEQATELNLHGLLLNLKIDRIDQLNNNTLALIDYKTGTPDNITNWRDPRPQSPQLPLYALAQDAPLEAIVYARIKRNDSSFIGVANESDFAAKACALENHKLHADFADWDAMIAHWRTALSKLAQEFINGEAQVEPIHPSVCERCDLHGLCRIDTASAVG